MSKKIRIVFAITIIATIFAGLVIGTGLAGTNEIFARNNDTVKKVGFYDDWEGRHVAWYGDSLTELYYHCDIVNKYFNFTGYNCGMRGASVSNINEYSLCRADRLVHPAVAIPTDVDVIIIMAGTNDWCANVKLGKKDMKFNEYGGLIVDDSTFYGACHEMFYNLTRNFPNAYILVMGAPPAAANTYDIYNELNLTCQDYGDALCEIASMWGIQSFNIGEMMGINPNNVSDKDGLMYEGLHFTEGAARRAANIIIQEICQRRYYD